MKNRFSRKLFLTAVLAGLLALVAYYAAPTRAADEEAPKKPAKPRADGLAAEANQLTGNEITDAQKESVKKGLKWLATRQTAIGNFQTNGYSNHPGLSAL